MTLRNDIEDPKFRRRNNISSIFVICFCDEKYVATNKSNNLLYESIYEKRDKDESK